MNEDQQKLYKVFDRKDTFIKGCSIAHTGRTKHTERVKNTPKWVNDNNEVKELLLRVFPKLQIDEKQRQAAAKWVLIINHYFRMGHTLGRISQELQLSRQTIFSTVRRIRKAYNSLKAGTLKHRGRPKNNNDYIDA